MSSYDWSKFRLRINIDVPVELVYAAWTTRQGLESWFLRKALLFASNGEPRGIKESIQAADTYEWYWFGYPDTVLEKGNILEANGYDLLRFSFAGSCIVTITIFTEEKETICELIQSQIPEDDASRVKFHLGCSNGWTFYLGNLKSILEGGIDLRNKNENLKVVVNS